ncbi:MAG TPA: hypothetical protein PLI58_07730 [Candidatus Syntrophosphaera sp.]|nr:hypothetical protein [Candidatus Syntrophosphaera sp.]
MKIKKMTKDEMNGILYKEGGINVDQVCKSGNVWTIRRGFFYRFGGSAEMYVEGVKKAFPNATILDSGEHWTDFRGGAPLAKSSHWFVKFILN